MEKKEILNFLYKMQENYLEQKKQYESVYINDINSNSFLFGFCCYIGQHCITKNYDDFILDELLQDVINKNNTRGYWYPTIFSGKATFEETIQPRINHLDRTIKRLEKEIQTENPTII